MSCPTLIHEWGRDGNLQTDWGSFCSDTDVVPNLYPRAVGSDRKYNIVDSNGRNSISLKGAWLSS